jgi:phosphoglycerate dehydrogenase-like enzyme
MKIWMRLDIPDEQADAIRARFPDDEFVTAEDTDAAQLATVDAGFTRDPVPDDVVAGMPNLRWLHIQHGGAAGYLTPHVIEQAVAVTTSTGVHGGPFAEFAIASLFVLAKKFHECLDLQAMKQWDESVDPLQLEGATLGIVGFGVIGADLARKASALGMRVLATKRTPAEAPPYVDELHTADFLPQLLAQSDYVVLTLPSTERDIIGEAELMGMKPGSFLVNLTARQAIAGEDVLIRALQDGPIAGAVLNCFAHGGRELPADSKLWALPNVIITPRLAGIGPTQWDKVMDIFADNITRFRSGEPLKNLVDPELGYARA